MLHQGFRYAAAGSLPNFAKAPDAFHTPPVPFSPASPQPSALRRLARAHSHTITHTHSHPRACAPCRLIKKCVIVNRELKGPDKAHQLPLALVQVRAIIKLIF
jgi:hypothetical protein